MATPRTILLVGEGNFSFSAALSQCSSKASITATCYQREEEALQHEGTATNIQIIRDLGGAVLFEVDSTKLGECTALKGDLFDRVVFNFPHCGRKSGVKKNRELLKHFFLSCVKVLAEDGYVHVALCNGQGGTPADQPMREWHNSWQVVAMAAEANLILNSVQPFESEKYESYKCTGYRSQDKGFHVEKALLHVFTRSLPYSTAQSLKVEESVDGKRVQYNVPAELSEYISREFLSTDSIHPVKLAQDFLIKGLAEKWSVSMKTETLPFLLSYKQLQVSGHAADNACCYWLQLRDKAPEIRTDAGITVGQSVFLASQVHVDTPHSMLDKCVVSEEGERHLCQGAKCLRSTCRYGDIEEGSLLVLRPSLLPQMEALLGRRPEEELSEEVSDVKGNPSMEIRNSESVELEGNESSVFSECFTGLLSGVSGLVFRNVPISLWAQPAFHQLLLRGVFPAACEPIELLGKSLETLLAPHGVSLVTESGCLCLMGEPMGAVGRVFTSAVRDNSRVVVDVCLNLDLLAALLFSLRDWRLLWSRDPRFLKRFLPRPPPGQCFRPFSLHPQHYSFDISFWAGPAWQERRFHAAVREASRGSVEQVQLIDTFSHPDLSQVSYCYRLTYRSHTHALSHAKALQLHQQLEAVLPARLHVTVR